LTNGLIEITNYTDAQTVTIYNGIGKIQTIQRELFISFTWTTYN